MVKYKYNKQMIKIDMSGIDMDKIQNNQIIFKILLNILINQK